MRQFWASATVTVPFLQQVGVVGLVEIAGAGADDPGWPYDQVSLPEGKASCTMRSFCSSLEMIPVPPWVKKASSGK